MRRFWLPIFIVAGSLALDQASKQLVDRFIPLHHSIGIIPDFFSLTHVRNPGAAFGLLADLPPLFRKTFFLLVSAIALVLLTFYLVRTPPEDRLGQTALALLLGGATGNMIDRLRLGEVIDFLDFYVGTYHWYTFNVADSAITVGISLLLLHSLLRKEPIV